MLYQENNQSVILTFCTQIFSLSLTLALHVKAGDGEIYILMRNSCINDILTGNRTGSMRAEEYTVAMGRSRSRKVLLCVVLSLVYFRLSNLYLIHQTLCCEYSEELTECYSFFGCS